MKKIEKWYLVVFNVKKNKYAKMMKKMFILKIETSTSLNCGFNSNNLLLTDYQFNKEMTFISLSHLMRYF